jgi:hypothetical protein
VAEDPAFAAHLWQRLRDSPGVVAALNRFAARDATGPPLGLNHRIRVLRYKAPPPLNTGYHRDGVVEGVAELPDEFQAHYDQVRESRNS